MNEAARDTGFTHAARNLAAWFRRSPINPSVLASLPVAAIFCLFRWRHYIAAEPYWLYIVLVTGAGVISVAASMLWRERDSTWHVGASVGANLVVIGVVCYGTGWGPILSIGFVFGAADSIQRFGSKATWPSMIGTAVCVACGQATIALGLAPTMIREPLAQGVGALGLIGALLVVEILGRDSRAREDLEAGLRQSERRFKALVSNANDMIVVADRSGGVQYMSPAFERDVGTFVGAPTLALLDAFVHPEDLPRIRREMSPLMSDPTRVLRTVVRGRDSSGRWRHFEAHVSNHLDDPDVRGVVANLHDVTDLREAEERFRSAFENAPIGMAIADLTGRIIRANPALGSIVGRSSAELAGMSSLDLTHPDDRESSRAEINSLVETGTVGYHIEKRYIHRDGNAVWVSVSVSSVRDDQGRPLYLIGQVEDITERRALRERLAFAAIHDPLTGLPNRQLFMDRLQVALRRSTRGRRDVTVLFLDLDRFKFINDSLGHQVGDQVLQLVASRLSSVMRASDTLARFGGDEFTVLCEDVTTGSDTIDLAERLVAAMGQPLAVQGGEVFVSLSIGIAQSRPGDAASELLRNADVAMYRAKARGPSHIEVYRVDEERAVVSRLRTSNELHRAIDRNELELHYQPFVELHGETLVGMEALVRWQHPTRGLLLPQEFIPLAEDSGMIVPLGAWVLSEACHQTAQWHSIRTKLGAEQGRLNMAVNVSAVQLSDPGFPRQVAEAVDASGIDPDQLWLELTESALMREPDEAVEVLNAICALGVHIEIDDFGTGYSSLSYLQRFPVECLKVDRSFVSELDTRPDNAAIVRAIIGLGDSLGLPVIAEGVEQRGEVTKLKSLGCHLAQGFLFGKPLPARALGTFPADDLTSWNTSRVKQVAAS